MPDPTSDERKLRSIPRTALSMYLDAHGWAEVAEWPERARVYSNTDAAGSQRIWVPLRETFADYADNMERSIRILAQAEGRSALQVFNDLYAANSDTIQIAALNPAAHLPLSLHGAGRLVNSTYALLAAAARAAEKPRAAYRGAMSAVAAQFLDAIEPAPLEFDQYALTLHSPVTAPFGQHALADDFAETPFARRTTVELANGLAAAADAIAAAKTSKDLSMFEQAVERGVSANLCGALADLVTDAVDAGDGLNVDVRWAAVRPRNGSQRDTTPFSIHDAEILKAARDYLRTRASYPDEHLKAHVFRLERAPGDFDGRATLLAVIDERPRRIEVQFVQSDYQAAIKAHDRQSQIELDGDIKPAGRVYELRNPRNVRLLNGDSA